MAELTLDVLTPTGPVAGASSISVAGVEVPGLLGELGILPGHIPFISALIPGVVRYRQDGKSVRLAVGSGFVEVSSDGRISVLIERALGADEIDAEKVRTELVDATEALSKSRDSVASAEHQKLETRSRWLQAQLRVIAN